MGREERGDIWDMRYGRLGRTDERDLRGMRGEKNMGERRGERRDDRRERRERSKAKLTPGQKFFKAEGESEKAEIEYRVQARVQPFEGLS